VAMHTLRCVIYYVNLLHFKSGRQIFWILSKFIIHQRMHNLLS